MHVGDRLQGVRRIQILPLREFDQDIDWIGTGEFRIEAAGCGDGLLLVGHLICEAIARLQTRIDDAQAGDDDQSNGAEQAGMSDHSLGDPAAERTQRIDPGISGLEFGGEDFFIPHQQHTEHRNKRQHHDQRNNGRSQTCFTKSADQIRVRELQCEKRNGGRRMG